MLSQIHETHLSITKCKQRARELLFWCGMASQIEEQIAQYGVCAIHQTANPREPIFMQGCPNRPWEIVNCDLFQFRYCIMYFAYPTIRSGLK